MNILNEDVFNLLLESADSAEGRKQEYIYYILLYIIPVIDHFSAGADLKFMSHCIENKIELEQFLKLGQQAMMR